MALRKYLVLELPRPSVRPESFESGPTLGADEPQLHIAELSVREAHRLQSSDVHGGAAPDIPVRLITPVAPGPRQRDIEPAILDPGDPPSPDAMWGLHAIGALQSRFDGDGVSVAIIDTGIDLEHDAFRSIRDRIEFQDYTGCGPGDPSGHGTHCAGTLFGQDVDGLRLSVAPRITRAFVARAIDSHGHASSFHVISALKDAVMKANVVSMSLGFDFPGVIESHVASGLPLRLAASQALRDFLANMRLFDILARFGQDLAPLTGGSLVIAAAGNESKPDLRVPVGQPACATDVISVGAVQSAPGGWTIAGFSNTGPTVSAPGTNILSAVPARAPGAAKLGFKTGTSMATPHVAGVAALWFQKLRAQNQGTCSAVAARLKSMVSQAFRQDTDPGDRGFGVPLAPRD